MKTKMGDKAVAEAIGAILLLAMAIVAFSVIYMSVLSDDGPGFDTYATVIGKMEGGDVVFEHNRGEGISTDSTISLFFAGNLLFQGKISDLPNFTGMENDIWDIGERIFYTPPSDIIPIIFQNKIQIEGDIADKRTNSLVFWGVIQKGYVEPEGGKGGIWHLDEGTGSIAHDSSGNNNHGYIHGSKWIPGKKNYALMFNSESSDYVRVPNGPGLYITDEITVETWICPLDTTSGIIDSYNFDEHASGITWIHISGDTFAFAYWYQGLANEINCRIQTVNLTSYGYIEDNPIDVYHFVIDPGPANGFDPDFLHIEGSVYAVAHRWGKDNGTVTTLNIYENGTINNDYIDRDVFEPDPSNAFRPDIIHVSGNIYAIASSEFAKSGCGNIATIEIEPGGNIPNFDDDIVIDRLEFESNNCSHPKLWKVSDNKFIVVYANIDYNESRGYVKTIEIENDGSINQTIFDTFEFESTRCFETDLEFISSDPFNQTNFYAIAYRGINDNGYITTIEVNDSGNITKNVIDSIKFDPSVYGGQPDIEYLNISNNTFAVAYLGPGTLGYLTTLKILDNGTISNIIDTFPFTTDYHKNSEMEPKIVHVSETIYGICFKGHAGKGYLITVAMSDEGIVEGIEGFGGIFKDNSYALKANATTVFATINNVTINLTGIIANSWNHIALTYDGTEMCLYINNGNSTNLSYVYPYENKEINFTEFDDLYFGYLFYGFLDEIAIFDRALSPEEIKYHYQNPGSFDYEPYIPPILSISNITSSEIKYNSAKITWDTDKPSTSLVRYGTTQPPTNIKSNSSLVTSHSIILTDLLPDQTYYYEVESTYSGNTITDNNNGIYHMFITKQVIHVDSIQMSYGPSGSKYIITTEVKIVNNTNEPVNGAIVTIELMLPDGSKDLFEGTTLSNGIATITPKTKYPQTGNYTSTVTNVEKAGFNYEPSYNVITFYKLPVP